jgi:uncharacterized protein DUF4136
MHRLRRHRSKLRTVVFLVILGGCLAAQSLPAKTVVDFNPDLDFSKFKTYAILGGVENLLMFQVNPGLMDERIRRAVNRELGKKGLREVRPGQRPDLVIRYWANPSSQVNVSTMGNWGPFDPFITANWAWTYNDVTASSAKEGSLIIDLIDPRSKALVWRLFLIHKITTPDKEWKKADDELTKAFESYAPSAKEIEEKKKERAAHSPKSN